MRNLLFFCLLPLAWGCGSQTAERSATAPTVVSGSVIIEVITDGKTQKVVVEDVLEGTTLEAVMRNVEEIEIDISGSGTTAFVNQIGDVATGSTEGWTYKVDGKHVNVGIGSFELTPPTTVSWSYGEYSP
ncbi:DUF4430 domain-containing protein [Rubripirellula amarantea]|uniref:Transcobalamin-like C-terminal domain-containing protein n=1 Tax=Rubripirellula amarantea TaxID=2527999 RepID=A0A5C5WV83_9BACT|nr:DUF4430 domain-containing protein [Rubripirellula amarantea]MDA8745758.1 DUF4430 domain-containing protein [Rubripirellula amarantea]TWT54566.1 hypothetical protein Pla22_22160 [Rubripirellula amarantea]